LIRERVGQVFDGYLGYFQQALADAARTGTPMSNADVQSTALGVLAGFQGALLLARTRKDASIIAEVGDHLLAGIFRTHNARESST